MAGFSFNHVGRGLGPKWRALRDINIGDELVCNYASEHFTRFDADVFRIDNPVAHEKPLRPLKQQRQPFPVSQDYCITGFWVMLSLHRK